MPTVILSIFLYLEVTHPIYMFYEYNRTYSFSTLSRIFKTLCRLIQNTGVHRSSNLIDTFQNQGTHKAQKLSHKLSRKGTDSM